MGHSRNPTRPRLPSVVMLSCCLSLVFGCARQGPEAGRGQWKTITVKGSDTLVILGQRWAEEYMKAHPGSVVQVTGGGSGTGIAALINGSTDICAASRPMKEQEKQEVQQRRGQAVQEIPVALDGITIFLNQANPVEALTLGQVKAIYTGTVTQWSEVGGKQLGRSDQIIVYGRENNSGTYLYFKEHVLGDEDFAPFVQSLPGTAAVINAVSKDSHAIGYGGIAYAKGVKAMKIKKDEPSAAVEPSLATVESGRYPISRSLYFYTVGEPQGGVKAFIDWALGEEGQKICAAVGYYPLRKTTANR